VRLSRLDGLSIGIWGAGREGLAALRALGPHARVLVHSDAPDDPGLAAARAAGAAVTAAGPEAWRELLHCEVVIRSPGLSIYRPELADLRVAGVTITTGTNLWFSEHAGASTIAVTGTKGKSTTSALIDHLLGAAGEPTILAGNVGRPLLDHLGDGTPETVWVLELSSFQIADLDHAPGTGVLLNLFDEHLDWHGSAPRYHADKLRLFDLEPACAAVLCGADPGVRALAHPAGPTRWFGTEETLHVRGGEIWDGARPLPLPDPLPLTGAHNLLNLCAALEVVRERGHDIERLALEALPSFRPLPHRLQLVGERDGVRFVNDSISTTPQSAIAALSAFAGVPVALIAGGYDRGQDYAALAAAVHEHRALRAVVVLPATGPRIIEELRRVVAAGPALHEAADLEAALPLAARAVAGGGVVLLSPAAPSFGAYRSFEERGEHFAALVAALP
jgi:UDP-N-acetylmuramoylalanine--D-glutamate ligase